MRSAILHAIGRKVRSLLPALVLALLPTPGAAAAGEYEVKAVFLFNFAQFVEWPPQAFADASTPLIIGILGDDPFGAVLDDVVRGETVNGRPLAVHRFRRHDEIASCHILYISQSEAGRLGQLVERLRGREILTVSDIDGAARHGVMIRFLTENRRIRLRINLDAVRAARLFISSKLLRPAEIVSGKAEVP